MIKFTNYFYEYTRIRDTWHITCHSLLYYYYPLILYWGWREEPNRLQFFRLLPPLTDISILVEADFQGFIFEKPARDC